MTDEEADAILIRYYEGSEPLSDEDQIRLMKAYPDPRPLIDRVMDRMTAGRPPEEQIIIMDKALRRMKDDGWGSPETWAGTDY